MSPVPSSLDERFRSAAVASGLLDVAFDIFEDTPVGPLLVGITDHGVCRITFDPDPERFFRVYSESVRDLGTPVFAKSYFRTLMAEFGPSCSVLTITAADRPVSSVLSFYFRDEVLPYYGGGTAEARELAGNDFMYWELMRRSCEAGYRIFDFGRSKRGTGAFAFKEHWGFAPEPLYHEYVLRRTDRMPEVNPLNPKYRLFIALWRRLPLAVANRLGPLIVRNLG